MIDEVEEKVEEAYIQKKEEGMNRFCLLQKKKNPPPPHTHKECRASAYLCYIFEGTEAEQGERREAYQCLITVLQVTFSLSPDSSIDDLFTRVRQNCGIFIFSRC